MNEKTRDSSEVKEDIKSMDQTCKNTSSQEYLGDEISLFDLWSLFFRYKKIFFLFTLVSVLISVAVAFVITPVYRAELLAEPVTRDNAGSNSLSTFANQFGGLASIAGFQMSSRDGIETVIATLKSRKFISKFIFDLNLKPILFEDSWDPVNKKWLISESGIVPGRQEEKSLEPTDEEAYKKFIKTILDVDRDKFTGLVKVSIEWKDSSLAANWANILVKRLNEELREKKILEGEKSIKYLMRQISETSISELQNVLYRIIEEQMKIVTLAKANDEYVLKVIDPALPPEKRSKPNRRFIVFVGGFIGIVLGVIYSLFVNAYIQWKLRKSKKNQCT